MFVHLDLQNSVNFIIKQHTEKCKSPENQYRKNELGGTKLPYFYHPIEVSTLVWKWGAGTPIAMNASLGHDLYEDTLALEEDVIRVLGVDANAVIKELTYDATLQSKEEYLTNFMTTSITALVIKLADRICNVRDFMLGDGDYALKYWKKASSLIVTYGDRAEEIADFFGVNAAYNIDKAIDNLDKQLSKYRR